MPPLVWVRRDETRTRVDSSVDGVLQDDILRACRVGGGGSLFCICRVSEVIARAVRARVPCAAQERSVSCDVRFSSDDRAARGRQRKLRKSCANFP